MSSSRLSPLGKAHSVLVIALLAWGALAFGAVYPWGYRVLAAAAIAAGAIGLYAGHGRQRLPVPVVVAFVVLLASILAQQIPLPRPVLERISPATVSLLAQHDVAFAATPSMRHALSIDPARTWTGVFLMVSLGALWFGLTAALNERLMLRIVSGIIVVGLGIAVIATVGLANNTGRVLGVWEPSSRAAPFGPFINRNHFAGWMLMSIPLGAGYLVSMAARDIAEGPRSWRTRIAWLSTRRANRMIMLTLALTVMTMSVLMSLSRSGIACLAIGLIAVGWLAQRHIGSRSRFALRIACIAIVATGCVGWAGLERIGVRFAEFKFDRSGGRVGIWTDAITIARTFPLYGTGLNTFGVSTLFFQTTDLHEHYQEAHNDYLQIAAEGGLLVGIPALALLVVVVREVRRRFCEGDTGTTFWLRVGAVAGMMTISLQEATEFSLQMPGNAALFCVLASIALHRSTGRMGDIARLELEEVRPIE